VFTFYHWTTSFLGVSVTGGSQPARLRGPPKPHWSRHVAPGRRRGPSTRTIWSGMSGKMSITGLV